MIKLSDGKVGFKEILAITMIAISTQATDTTVDNFIFLGENAAWMIPIFSFVFLLIPFLVLVYLLHKHKVGLMELLEQLLGKWFSIPIGLLLFVVIFVSFTTNSRSYIDIVNTMYYPRTAISMLSVIFLIGIMALALKGFEAIGRSVWFLFWLFQGIGLFLLFTLWSDTNWSFLMPIAGPGFGELLSHSFLNLSVFGEVILLAVFYTHVRTGKEFSRGVLLGWFMSAFWLATIIALSTAVFDYPAVQYMNYSYQQMTRVSSIGSFTHLDGVFLGIWIIAAVYHFAIYLYISAFIFGAILKIDNFERLILPLTGLAYYLGLFPDNIIHQNMVKGKINIIGSVIYITLPFLLLLIDRIKGLKAR